VGVSRPNFAASWEELTIEREETYALSNANTLPEAVKNIISFLGMQPCDRTDRVPEGKSSHALALAGKRILSESRILNLNKPRFNIINKYSRCIPWWS